METLVHPLVALVRQRALPSAWARLSQNVKGYRSTFAVLHLSSYVCNIAADASVI
jgi:hypothetical protein